MRWVIFTLAIFKQLTEREYWSFQKEFGNNTSDAENVHGPVYRLFAFWLFTRGKKPLRRKVTGAAPGHVEVEREICRVVLRQISRLIRRGEVRQVQPVPGGDKYILGFDVSVVDIPSMTIAYRTEKLESQPFLLNIF
jgi:hypothetical protein